MKKLIGILAIVFIGEMSFAGFDIICVGGFKDGKFGYMVELLPKDRSTLDVLEGTLATRSGAFDFEVRKKHDGYYYRAQAQDPAFLYISEDVPSLPAVRSNRVSPGQEIYIDCKPYSLVEYCRIHTC